MRIQPTIYSFNSNQSALNKNPKFCAWDREVFRNTKDGFVKELKHRNDTSFFRDGFFWNSLVYHLLHKYNKTPKVNFYNFACSDGSEPYTFLMSIIGTFGLDNVKKFLPIKAMDYDPVAIQKAKTAKYELKDYEKNTIQAATNFQLDLFFDSYNDGNKTIAIPREILTDNVAFRVANILRDYKKIEPNNSVVLARNFWPYLREDAITLTKKLGSQMGKNSTLVLGNYDIKGCEWHGVDIEQELIKNGFKKGSIDLVFEKED